MKSFFLISTLVLSTQAFSQNTVDQAQMIKDGKCIPHRDSATGNITKYICDQNELNRMQKGNFQQLGTQKIKKMEIKTH